MSGILMLVVAVLVAVVGGLIARVSGLQNKVQEWTMAFEAENSLRMQGEAFLNRERARLRDELEDQKGALQYFEERSIAIVAERVQECLEGAKAPLKEEIAELRLRIDKLCEERSKLQRTISLQNPRARKLVEVQRLENERICPGCGEHCIMMRDEGGE